MTLSIEDINKAKSFLERSIINEYQYILSKSEFEYISMCLISRVNELYPPSLEALKAEPWRWLIADPRDPRAKELIGKKVFVSNVSVSLFKNSGTLKKIDDRNMMKAPFVIQDDYYEDEIDTWLFIWPAPIDMQEETR